MYGLRCRREDGENMDKAAQMIFRPQVARYILSRLRGKQNTKVCMQDDRLIDGIWKANER